MIRFAEKSFEVRFCAALSAALMPFNRNPHWFGMTQAEERKNGIDTMLEMGGYFLLFQFKAKNNNNFKIEKYQWNCLERTAQQYPGSTYYVFPEALNEKDAASYDCLFNHSWCSFPFDIGRAFKKGSDTVTLSLDTNTSALIKKRPKTSIPTHNACGALGCFCDNQYWREMFLYTGYQMGPQFIFRPPHQIPSAKSPLPPFRKQRGIPVGAVPSERGRPPIESSEDFERLLGDEKSSLFRGLFGLFLPREASIG